MKSYPREILESMERKEEITVKLDSPITEEQWDKITDVNFDHTDSVEFHTKKGKTVRFVKKENWIPVEEWLPKKSGFYMCTVNDFSWRHVREMKFEILPNRHRWVLTNGHEVCDWYVLAWMPLPKPYKGVAK